MTNRCSHRLLNFALFVVLGFTAQTVDAEGILSVSREGDDALVMIDDELFVRYATDLCPRPVLWPVIGPTGAGMTRDYPLALPGEEEELDHIHHTSMWIGYEGVNGYDYWHATEGAVRRHFPIGAIKHREYMRADSTGKVATIATRNDWTTPSGATVAHDERVLEFGLDGDDRWIDVRFALWSSSGPLRMGDTKEGFFAYRVPGTMKVDAGHGGRIVNAEGLVDADAWGKPSAWNDYSGPVAGETVGVAIFTHPESHNPRPRWHVRPYGLFAANPIGVAPYVGSDREGKGGIELPEGERLRLRYRIVLHRGGADEAQIAEKFERYAK